MKKIRRLHWLVKCFILIDLLIIACFVFVYGPNDYAKVYWITTSMTTNNHRFLANIFYSEDTIKQVMEENTMEELDEETDISDIVIGSEEEITSYTSIYERQILERDKDDLYKLIEFKYKGFNCYLVAIYDPKRIEAAYNNPLSSGQILTDISKKNNALVAINGGGYSWATSKPQGLIVHDGKIVYSQSTASYVTAAFNEDGILIVGKLSASDVAKKNIKEALSFGPVFVANGKYVTFKGNGGGGENPRTVIAQRKDGIAFFLVINGYGQGLSWKGRGGVYYTDILTILQRYGAYNAVNMDGGSSTTLVIDNKLINSPCEPLKEGQDFIRSAWILK